MSNAGNGDFILQLTLVSLWIMVFNLSKKILLGLTVGEQSNSSLPNFGTWICCLLLPPQSAWNPSRVGLFSQIWINSVNPKWILQKSPTTIKN